MGTGLLSPLTSWGRDSLGKAGRGVGDLEARSPGRRLLRSSWRRVARPEQEACCPWPLQPHPRPVLVVVR